MWEALLFVAGLLVGAAGCYLVLSRSRSESAIEKQLRELQEEFSAYRENVNQHFNRTADLVNNLTETYVKVQKHLEDAATSFSEPPKSFSLDSTAKSSATPATSFVALEAKEKPRSKDATFGDEYLQAPRDYAPKASPKEKGTLAEDFGLDRPPF